MRIVICDDEELARSRLCDQVTGLKGFDVIGTATNGLEMLELCQAKSPDIVLLDIRMPVMDGLEAARHLGRLLNPPAIIFTTAYDQHAIKAFETSASDYLLKPVRQQRLMSALQKARRLNRAQLAAIQELEQQHPERTHLSVYQRGNLVLVPVSDVLYFHADQKYVCVGTAKQEVLIEESLKSLEQEFEERFIRIHRATLVARRYIQELVRHRDGKAEIRLLHSGRQFEVSRRLLASIRKSIKSLKAG